MNQRESGAHSREHKATAIATRSQGASNRAERNSGVKRGAIDKTNTHTNAKACRKSQAETKSAKVEHACIAFFCVSLSYTHTQVRAHATSRARQSRKQKASHALRSRAHTIQHTRRIYASRKQRESSRFTRRVLI